MREPVRDVARGKWRGILPQLGVLDEFLSGKHGPCPICGGKDRFRFTDYQGSGGWICNQCGSGDGIGLLMKLRNVDFREAAKLIEGIAGDVSPTPPKAERSGEDMHSAMRALWMASRRIEEGDCVWRYLNGRTGATEFPPDLRTVEALRHSGPPMATHPGMIGIVRDAAGKACQVHRTWLTRGGEKAAVEKPKQLMPGRIERGAAIRLGAPAEAMGIAEGIETALSCAAMWHLPVWSAISAGNMVHWAPPPGVNRVLVFGDNDASFTGQHAAYALASVLRRKGLTVEVHIPEHEGQDWNDVHREDFGIGRKAVAGAA